MERVLRECFCAQANTRNGGDTLLHTAAGQGHLNCLRVLLEYNADITATVSALLMCIMYEKYVGKLSVQDVKGNIPLHCASGW